MRNILDMVEAGLEEERWYKRIVIGMRVLSDSVAFIDLIPSEGRVEQFIVPVERLATEPADSLLKMLFGHFGSHMLLNQMTGSLDAEGMAEAIRERFGSCRGYLEQQGIERISIRAIGGDGYDTGEVSLATRLNQVVDEALIDDIAVFSLRVFDKSGAFAGTDGIACHPVIVFPTEELLDKVE